MNFNDLLKDLGATPSFEFFKFMDINPVSGRKKVRTVAAPNKAMKELQRRFLDVLREREHASGLRPRALDYSTSSNKGDSPFKNVSLHRKNRFLYLLDFSNAYGSVKAGRLARVLVGTSVGAALGENSRAELTQFLERYFFAPKMGLIQGGPASQDLFNLYVGTLVDLQLEPLLKEKGMVYTRYIDDLTFSSQEPITEATRRAIRAPIIAAGFLINHKKCEYVDLEKRTAVVTGIGLARGGRLFVPRPYVTHVRGVLHRAMTKGDIKKSRVEGMAIALSTMLRNCEGNRLEEKVLKECNEFLRKF